MTTTSDPAAYFGRQVREERTARGWHLHEFGQQIAYHPAAISRVENGKRPPTESFADQCDRVFPERGGWFHEFWEESRGWMALPAWLRDWASHERSTRVLRDWCPSIVTGLLQTEEYARCTSATTPMVGEDEVSARVAARMARQQRVLLGMTTRRPRGSCSTTSPCCGTSGLRKSWLASCATWTQLPACRTSLIQIVPPAAHAGILGGFT